MAGLPGSSDPHRHEHPDPRLRLVDRLQRVFHHRYPGLIASGYRIEWDGPQVTLID